MTAWAAVAGGATVWLLVIVLATGIGYAAVLAWGRWGGRLPLPDPVGRAVALALGPAAQVGGVLPPARPDEGPVAVPAPDDAGASVAAAPAAVAVARADVQGAVFTAAEPASTQAAETILVEPAEAPGRAPAPVRTLSRTEAVSELSGVLGVPYDAAAALVAQGLWGFENHDEWSHAMRGRPCPPEVPSDAWTAATQAAWRDLEPRVLAYREKQQALGRLEGLWGVGPEEAEALYEAGYRDVASLRKASTDAIAKVPGIGAAKAFQIRAAAHGLAPTA